MKENKNKIFNSQETLMSYALKTIDQTEEETLSFREWVRAFGIYSCGMDIVQALLSLEYDFKTSNEDSVTIRNTVREIERRVNDTLRITIALGKALCKAELSKRIRKSDLEIIETEREQLASQCMFDRTSLKLK